MILQGVFSDANTKSHHSSMYHAQPPLIICVRQVLRTQLFNKISRTERGSTHPPTDAQAAALIVHESAEGMS